MTDFSLEKAAMARGCAAVCGCDEAGAGPLMGPVYAAAVILPVDGCMGGDGRSASIAAASVLAKVSRDRYVCRVLDPLYPQYQFARHKGYGTKLHYAMLDRYGPCPEHRMSFLTKWKERRT